VTPIPANLKKRLEKMLGKKECGDFVKGLIDQVAASTRRPYKSDNLLALFNAITGPGGGGYVLSSGPLMIRGSDGIERLAYGTVAGSMSNIGVDGAVPPTVIMNPLIYYSVGSEKNEDSYVMTALHETIHLAASSAWYDDLALADAVKDMGGLSEKELEDYNKIDRSDPSAHSASSFWNGILQKRCN
jgi:hypothetical protein